MLYNDLLNALDINSAMHCIEDSLITEEKITTSIQLKNVITKFLRYDYGDNGDKYIKLFIALIKNCLKPKLYISDSLFEKINNLIYRIKSSNKTLIYSANINQGWIPKETYFLKLISEFKIDYLDIINILKIAEVLPKKNILSCRDLFSPVYSFIDIFSQTKYSIQHSSYGKEPKSLTYTESDHLLFLQKFCDIDLNEFYKIIFANIGIYLIKNEIHTIIYQYMIKQFNENKLKISFELFLAVNKHITFVNHTHAIKIYINLIDKLTAKDTRDFFSSTCYGFSELFNEMFLQQKIAQINDHDEIIMLLTKNFSLTITMFYQIYSGKKDMQLLIDILSIPFLNLSTNNKYLIDFVKKYLEENSIEINNELFILFCNINMKDLIEYCFENKYCLTDSVILKIYSTNIIDNLKIANNYNYYITDKVFNHVYQILFYTNCNTNDEKISILKSLSIYKNEEDNAFIEKTQQLKIYNNQLNSYKTQNTINYKGIVTKEMIINADKPLVRQYLLDKYLEQNNNKNEDVTNEQCNKIVKKVIKRVVKKVVKKTN